jgi:hypothetical protein
MFPHLLAVCSASLRFSDIVSNGVLQHYAANNVWGSGAAPSATVTVSVGGVAAGTATADREGNWTVVLENMPTRWSVDLAATSAGSTPANTTVAFGEVVMCAGQSNMDMPVDCSLQNRSACFSPKLMFRADNGTAEVAASTRYTNKIWLLKVVQSKYEKRREPTWATASPSTLASHSAVCWYSGKALFEGLGGQVPVGLMQASVGGSPIEYWLPAATKMPVNTNACEADVPQCDNQFNDSSFFEDIVTQLIPHTFGALVWDQAERDVKCPVSTAAYACMQELLVTSWRKAFDSPDAAFVAVQLPGYTGALANGTGVYPGFITGEMVWAMRLQQARGAAAVANGRCAPCAARSQAARHCRTGMRQRACVRAAAFARASCRCSRPRIAPFPPLRCAARCALSPSLPPSLPPPTLNRPSRPPQLRRNLRLLLPDVAIRLRSQR